MEQLLNELPQDPWQQVLSSVLDALGSDKFPTSQDSLELLSKKELPLKDGWVVDNMDVEGRMRGLEGTHNMDSHNLASGDMDSWDDSHVEVHKDYTLHHLSHS